MQLTTLKSRIIILITIFTVLTIAIFISIQLAHELETVRQFIKYKASKESLTIKEKFNEVLNSSFPQAEKIGLIGKGLNSLQEVQSIEKAYILDREAKVIFSTEAKPKGESGDYNDLAIVNISNEGESISGETVIDKSSKLLSVYIPLKDNAGAQFILRVFFPLGDIWQALRRVYQPAAAVGILLVIINIFLSVFFARLVVRPIAVFNKAAKEIASGRLDLRVHISTNDELEELGSTFNFMTAELAKIKKQAENANPLTKLPGNIVIMEEVEKRIKAAEKFAVIYCDLDNFKVFNDKYGIYKGDEAIKLTGELFKEAVKNKGKMPDFVGHEGGDDFFVITVPERAQPIADYIISEFDKRIRALYDKDDLARGRVIAQARDGSIGEFPIMAISLAEVTNQHRQIRTYAEVTNIAAELKKKAKKDPKSCFVVDRRVG